MKALVIVSTVNLMNCFISSGDVGAASDAFGASARGRGAKRGNNARSAENLQPTESRR